MFSDDENFLAWCQQQQQNYRHHFLFFLLFGFSFGFSIAAGCSGNARNKRILLHGLFGAFLDKSNNNNAHM